MEVSFNLDLDLELDGTRNRWYRWEMIVSVIDLHLTGFFLSSLLSPFLSPFFFFLLFFLFGPFNNFGGYGLCDNMCDNKWETMFTPLDALYRFRNLSSKRESGERVMLSCGR